MKTKKHYLIKSGITWEFHSLDQAREYVRGALSGNYIRSLTPRPVGSNGLFLTKLNGKQIRSGFVAASPSS